MADTLILQGQSEMKRPLDCRVNVCSRFQIFSWHTRLQLCSASVYSHRLQHRYSAPHHTHVCSFASGREKKTCWVATFCRKLHLVWTTSWEQQLLLWGLCPALASCHCFKERSLDCLLQFADELLMCRSFPEMKPFGVKSVPVLSWTIRCGSIFQLEFPFWRKTSHCHCFHLLRFKQSSWLKSVKHCIIQMFLRTWRAAVIPEDPDVWQLQSFIWFKIRVRTSEKETLTWNREKAVDWKCFHVRDADRKPWALNKQTQLNFKTSVVCIHNLSSNSLMKTKIKWWILFIKLVLDGLFSLF